jgi:GT2 family glycosyltransferase
MTLRNFFQPRPSAPEEAQDIDAAISMALLVRREPVLATGGYDPNYFILFEDHDLSYRLRAQGHRIRLVPDALVYHREGTAGISYREGPAYPQRRAFLHSRNRWMVLIRNHSLPALCWGMPGILGYELVWMAFATVRGLLGSYLRGKGALLKLLPQLLRERHGIQRQRKVRDRLLLKALPLTHAPMVKASAMARGFDQCLNAMLRTWWRCVSLLLP